MQTIIATYSRRVAGRRGRTRKPSRMLCLPLLFMLLSAVIVALAYSRPNIFALTNGDGGSGSDNDNQFTPDLPSPDTGENGLTDDIGGGYQGNGFVGFFEQVPTVFASDSLGNDKELFEPDDSMYATVPAAGQSVTFFVTAHHTTWVDGDALVDVSGGTEVLTLNPSGIQTVEVWMPLLVSGSYDVVLDSNNNGVFDSSRDATDTAEVHLYNVVPEVPFGTLLASVGMIAGVAGFVGFKHFRINVS